MEHRTATEEDVVYMVDKRNAIDANEIEGCQNLGRQLEALAKQGKIKYTNPRSKITIK